MRKLLRKLRIRCRLIENRSSMAVPVVLDGSINGDWFEAYVSQVLVPDLRRSHVIIWISCPATSALASAI